MDYTTFLESKRKQVIESGFEVDSLNQNLFDFQEFIVKRALKAGKYAVFADTGLGKTIMQLSWANQVTLHTNKPVLILAPLAVSGQTIEEGKKFGIEVQRLKSDVFGSGIFITNYEQLDNVNCDQFSGVVLDESSILKNYTGKYKNQIINVFSHTPYKLACTATPSPNDINEIGNHSEFLGILDAQDMRSRWFVRDDGMNNYRLKHHAKKEFYKWVGSWCTMITNPANLGFNETGKKFNLGKLNYIEHGIETSKQDNGKLFNDATVNATNFNAELRRSMKQRLELAAGIANESNESFIVWINQNEEEKILKKLIPDCVTVNGSEKPEAKEKKLLGFAKGGFRVLVTKKKIAQFGLNFQNCNNQIFASLDFSFEGLYQAIRRSYRFGQKKTVNIHLITLDTMQNVIESIRRKEGQFKELQTELRTGINKEYGLVMDYKREEVKTDEYHLIKGDSVEEINTFKDNSLDFSIFSPPFSMLFTYSNSYR